MSKRATKAEREAARIEAARRYEKHMAAVKVSEAHLAQLMSDLRIKKDF